MFPHFTQSPSQILRCGGFPDSALSVNCYLSHILTSVICLVCIKKQKDFAQKNTQSPVAFVTNTDVLAFYRIHEKRIEKLCHNGRASLLD
jgi:hypothetical protein